MKLQITFNNYNHDEFTAEDLKPIELFITNQLKDYERLLNTVFLYKGITFIIATIGYNLSENTKEIFINQLTTKKKSVIEKPTLINFPGRTN